MPTNATVFWVSVAAVLVLVAIDVIVRHQRALRAWWMSRATVQPYGLDAGKIYIILYDERYLSQRVIVGLSEYLMAMKIEAVFCATDDVAALRIVSATTESLYQDVLLIQRSIAESSHV